MREAYICDFVRTPIGRYGGTSKAMRTDDLTGRPLRVLEERNGSVSWEAVDGADYVNPHGEAVALGYPLGMSGARLAMALVNGLEQHGLKRGVATMCIGVGQGIAALVERV